jgi:hypothetical protein
MKSGYLEWKKQSTTARYEFEASTLLIDSESMNYSVRFEWCSMLLVGISVLVVGVREKRSKTLY